MIPTIAQKNFSPFQRLPEWFKQEIPPPSHGKKMKGLLEERQLHTVCEAALCPNLGQCWGKGVATFLILGDFCTRACRFCAVPNGLLSRPDPQEPQRVAMAVKSLGLHYVVITSVTRDDLSDGGAGHFARTLGAIRAHCPEVQVEFLIPDFKDKEQALETVLAS